MTPRSPQASGSCPMSQDASTVTPVRIDISSRWLGQPVRFDGGHKRDAFLVDVFGRDVEWAPVCPEVETNSLWRGHARTAMRVRRVVVGFILITALMASADARAHAEEREGAALYRDNCSVCHGMISSEASFRPPTLQPPHFIRRVTALSCERWPTHVGIREAQGESARGAKAGFDTPTMVDGEDLAVAPPYGPPLRGVAGRRAGSVEGYAYSRAFKRILQGVVWNRETLERWITDSQAWVPGSMMFYSQPDPEIRRQIITYLEANR